MTYWDLIGWVLAITVTVVAAIVVITLVAGLSIIVISGIREALLLAHHSKHGS